MNQTCVLALAATVACEGGTAADDDDNPMSSSSTAASTSESAPTDGGPPGDASSDTTSGTSVDGDSSASGDPDDDSGTDSGSTGDPGVMVDPGTLVAFLAYDFGGVSVLTIEDGVATELEGSPFGPKFARMNNVLVVDDRLIATMLPTFDPQLFTFDIEPSTGALTLAVESPTGGQYADLVRHPTMERVYATNMGDATVRAFAIGVDGSLNLVGDAQDAGSFPTGAATRPDGSQVYVASQDGFASFPVQGDGSVAVSAPFAGPVSSARSVAVSAEGDCLYGGVGDGIAVATIDGNGLPTLLVGRHDRGTEYHIVRTPQSETYATDFIVATTVDQTLSWRADGAGACELSTQAGVHAFGGEPSNLLEVDGGFVVGLVDTSAELHVLGVSETGAMEPIDGSPFAIAEEHRDVQLMRL
ncbi:MAG: beta-propeller fold lactonase family protein [Myxococcota bacterium]